MKSKSIFKVLFALLAIAFTAVTVVSYFCTGIVDVGGVSMAAINMASITLDADYGAVDGDENMGGLSVVGYFIPYSHITGWPTFAENPATMDELVQAIGNFTLAANKHWIKLYGKKYPQLTPESQGEHVGGKSFKCTGEIGIIGFKKGERGISRLMNNSQGVFIFLNDDGDRIALGTQHRPATFDIKGHTGASASDPIGFDITINADSFIPGYEYNGTIALSGSTLPAIS